MSFVQNEIDRIRLQLDSYDERYDATKSDRLMAAMQALEWALHPTAVVSPFNEIMGIKNDPSNGLPGVTINPAGEPDEV